jgi:hypothetical protein
MRSTNCNAAHYICIYIHPVTVSVYARRRSWCWLCGPTGCRRMYVTTLSVWPRMIRLMLKYKEFWKKRLWFNRSIILAFSWRNWGKQQNFLLITASVPAGIERTPPQHEPALLRVKFFVDYIGCSFCRLIRRPEHLIGRHWYLPQTEGQSFGDHLISESVSVTPSSVVEASIVLCSVSLWLVWVNGQSAYSVWVWNLVVGR